MKVVIRADASFKIGAGHVTRCITLAEALRSRGADCHFICRNLSGNLVNSLRKQGFAVSLLPHIHQNRLQNNEADDVDLLGLNWEDDLDQTKSKVEDTTIDWLIVDHYALDSRWESAMRRYCRKIMVIDDLANRNHDCDLLLDQNLVAEFDNRYDQIIPTNCVRLLGPQYALLQSQYAHFRKDVSPRLPPVRRIFVYFGGSDSGGLTERIIFSFLELRRSEITLDVVINPDVPHANAIREQVSNYPNVLIHANLPSLAHLMLKADLSIGAAGATTWERCCLGLPSIVVTLASNQRPIASELNRRGIVRWLGEASEISDSSFKLSLRDAIDDQDLTDWSMRCMDVVDGLGVDRVAAIISLNSNTSISARAAHLNDEALILSWANDPLVRLNAFNPQQIDSASHNLWFRRRLGDPNYCRLYVIETIEKLPIGQVRFERVGDEWEIHYLLAAVARGRKLGKKILQCALLELRGNLSSAKLYGRVKQSNIASQRVFESLNFLREEGKEGEIVYRYFF